MENEVYKFPNKSKKVVPDETNAYIYVGIDFGSTHSSISYYDSYTHQTVVIQDQQGYHNIPTCICFSKNKSGKLILKFGTEAKNDTTSATKLYGSKMFIGKNYDETLIKMKDRKFMYRKGIGRNFTAGMTVNFDDGTTIEFTPEEISGLFIAYLKKLLETKITNLSERIGGVCITVPVDFDENQKNSLINACEIAGFERKYITTIFEPTSSISSYASYFDGSKRKNVMVFDVGGGTFDVNLSVVEKNDVFENDSSKYHVIVKSTGGDQCLGGVDLDAILRKIVEKKTNKVLKENKMKEFDFQQFYKLEEINPKDPKSKQKRKEQMKKQKQIYKFENKIEEMKIILSTFDEVQFDSEEFLPIAKNIHESESDESNEIDLSIEITREEFEKAIKEDGILDKMKMIINLKLEEVGWNGSEIDLCIFVGGTCLIPIVKETIKNYLRRKNSKIQFSDDQFDTQTAVVRGAAIKAYRYWDNLFNVDDTLPYSLSVVFEDNQSIPIFKTSDKVPKITIHHRNLRPVDKSNRAILIALRKEVYGSKPIIIQKVLIPLKDNEIKKSAINLKFCVESEEVWVAPLNENDQIDDTRVVSFIQSTKADKEVYKTIEHLKESIPEFVTMRKSPTEKPKHNIYEKTENCSFGIYFDEETTTVYFVNTQNGEKITLTSSQSNNFFESYMTIQDNDEKDKCFSNVKQEKQCLKLFDLENYLNIQNDCDINGLHFSKDGDENVLFKINNSSKSEEYYLWDVFAYFLFGIVDRMISVQHKNVKNVIISIPSCFSLKMKQYLNNCCHKRIVSNVNFYLMSESYIAATCLHQNKQDLVKVGNRIEVINFRSTGIEIDVFVIENLNNDFITKFRREKIEKIEELSNEHFDEFIYDLIITEINKIYTDFSAKFLPNNDEIENKETKKKFNLKRKLMEMASFVRKEIIITQKDVTINWVDWVSSIYDIVEDENHSFEDESIEIHASSLERHIKLFINTNLAYYLNLYTENIDHIIIIEDLFEYQPLNKFLVEIFKSYSSETIHYFENGVFKEVLCQLAENLDDFDDIEIN